MSLPHIFIASSTRSLLRAQSIGKSLQGLADVLIWSESFHPGGETFVPLVERAFSTDFAIFLFTRDDTVSPFGAFSSQPQEKSRDNVILEFGLFFGILGRDRVFTILEKGVVLPSDLKAMTVDALFDGYPEMTQESCGTELRYASEAIRKRLTNLFPSHADSFCREASKKLREALRKLNKTVYDQVLSTREQFRVELAERLLKEARSEVGQALSVGNYFSEITLEKSFLNRARHIFGRASSVFATSVDRYSKFWLHEDEAGKELVSKYIDTQPENTFRLFVFTNPRSAAFHRTVLSDHFRRYGRSGGVFLTTLNNYLEYLKNVPHLESSAKFLTEDFAFLDYTDSNARTSPYIARLSQNTLRFDPLASDDELSLNVKNALLRMANIRPHEFDSDNKTLRWGRGFQIDDGRWCQALETLFQPDPPEEGAEDADILHLVFFKKNSPKNEAELTRSIANARRRLALSYSLQRDQGLIRDIWFGRNTKLLQNMIASDELTGAEVRPHQRVTKRYPFCLMVRVDGRAAYQEYLGNRTHHDVRKEIQQTFGDAAIARLLQEILKCPADNRKCIFEELEQKSQRFMVRAAYMRDEDIRSLVDLEINLRGQPALRRALQF